MDYDLLESAYCDNVKAVVAVHIYGQSSDIFKIKEFCLSKGIYLIEDVAQAHGGQMMEKDLGVLET